MPRTLKLVLAYDGTDLVGWQRQAAGVSVQARLEDALSAIEGAPVPVVGAGRTDAGVHALGQVASCRIDHPLPVARLASALNAMLPDDIRVLEVEEVDDAFHARYGARLKTYRYLLLNSAVVSPFERRYVWHVPQPLDVGAMAAGAGYLRGRTGFRRVARRGQRDEDDGEETDGGDRARGHVCRGGRRKPGSSERRQFGPAHRLRVHWHRLPASHD